MIKMYSNKLARLNELRLRCQRKVKLNLSIVANDDKTMKTKKIMSKKRRIIVTQSQISKLNKFVSSSSCSSGQNLLLALSLLLILNLVGCQFALGLMNLPDGIENILGYIPKSTFKCERDGYFGDIDNECRIFHLCQKQVHPNGQTEWRHWTYACGNQTMFNQLTLTCAFVDEAIPCRHASQFQYLNEVIHKPREPFLTDADVTSGISYYNNRVLSDGARARAFEDSNLMAQIGGGQAISSLELKANSLESFQELPTQQDNSMRIQASQPEQPQPEVQIKPQLQSQPKLQHRQHQLEAFHENFAFHHHESQPISMIPTGDHTGEIIINQLHHFQHGPTQFAPSNRPESLETLVVNSQPPPPPPASAPFHQPVRQNQNNFMNPPQASNVPDEPIEPSQPKNQPVETMTTHRPAQSFDFSISTNHGPGSSPALASPPQLAFPSGQFGPPPPPPPPQVQPESQPELPLEAIPIETPAPRTPATIGHLVTTTESLAAIEVTRGDQGSQEATTSSPLASTIAPPLTTTANFAPSVPATTTISPITTTTSTTTTTTTTAQTSEASLRQQLHPRASRMRTIQRKEDKFRARSGFQSVRLSSLKNETRSKRSESEPALVMRKQTNQQVDPVESAQPRRLADRTLWQLDSSFLAPRFEYLLTRRRV